MKATKRALALLAVLAVPMASAADLDRDALARVIANLKSNAQETRLFLAALRDGQLTYQYARIHREELAKQVRDCAKPLDKAAPEPLAAKAARAKTAAAKLAATLEGLAGHIGESDAARQAASEAETSARDIDKLESGP
jgi:hypothetical protein